MTTHPTTPTSPVTRTSPRRAAAIAGVGLLLMAALGPFAFFGVLENLMVRGDATATVDNIAASQALFRSGVAAFLAVIVLDVVVAWALYVLFEPVNRTLSLLTAWLRLAYAVVFGAALANLLDVAQLLGGSQGSTLSPDQLQAQVTTSLISFHSSYEGVGLAIFGLHLFGLGYLVFRSVNFPRFLGALVALAGAGYLFDSLGTILVSDYSLAVSAFTFIGEALLIPWLLWRAIKGFPAQPTPVGTEVAWS